MAAVGLVVGVAAVLLLRGRGGFSISGDRPGSRVVHGPVVHLAAVVSSYHVVYRVETGPRKRLTVTTDRLWVRRPFDSREENLAGAPPGRRVLSTAISAFGRTKRDVGGSQPAIIAVPPAPAVGDLRIGNSLPDAIAHRAALRRERRVVAHHACQVYRVGGPPIAGVLQPYEPKSRDFVDFCVDRDGVLLEQMTMAGRAVVRRQVATSVQVDLPLPDSLFAVTGDVAPVKSGGGSIRPLDPASRPPGTFWELAVPPAGFTRLGRYAVVPSQPVNFQLGHENARTGGVADVWQRGSDIIVVDRGGTLGGAPPFSSEPTARRVDLGPLGSGELIVGLVTSQVRVSMAGGHYVSVAGTVVPDLLVSTARQLTQVPGGQLVYLDR